MKALIPFASALALSIVSSAAVAETPQERQACMNDAFRVCSSAIPDQHAVYMCMSQNVHLLSAPCRAVMAQHPHSNATEARSSTRRNEEAANSNARSTTGSGAGGEFSHRYRGRLE